MNSVQPYVAE